MPRLHQDESRRVAERPHMRERNETVYQLVLKINEIQPDQWDEVDERDYRLIDAALRRAKVEVWREAATVHRQVDGNDCKYCLARAAQIENEATK